MRSVYVLLSFNHVLCLRCLIHGHDSFCLGDDDDQHGGSTNAFTSSEHTNFFFDINSDCFEEALDRYVDVLPIG